MNKFNIINMILTMINILCMFTVIFCDNSPTVDLSIISFQFIIIFAQICLLINIIRKRNNKNLKSKKV